MAHFAKLSTENEVLTVVSVNDSDILNDNNQEDETVGQQYLETHNNWPANLWIKTSYNTRNGKYLNLDSTEHTDQTKAFRGNYACIGDTWDSVNEIFWRPQPYNSWTKNTTTASWDPPITYPSETDDGLDKPVWTWNISWNETAYQANNAKGWEATKTNVDGTDHTDTSTYDWNGSSWVAQS